MLVPGKFGGDRSGRGGLERSGGGWRCASIT